MWLVLSTALQFIGEIIKITKLMGAISAAFALLSGFLWFVGASTQQTLHNVKAIEGLEPLMWATMDWQTKGAIAALIAGFFALVAAFSSKD